jgi:serine/threonine-protein kinase
LEAHVDDCPACQADLAALGEGLAPEDAPPGPAPAAKAEWILDGRWRMGPILGVGASAVVYAAEDVETGQPVAVKLLSRELGQSRVIAQRFQREGRLLRSISHPNLIPIIDVGRVDGVPFIVMKRLQGTTLATVFRTRGTLPADELLRVAGGICAGLGALHERGIVHRDLKPQNVFIAPDGHVTILDLGLALARDGKRWTASGMTLGTPHYIAPEQIRGAKEAQPPADVYALGVILFEGLAGKRPFEGSDLDVMVMHWSRDPPDLAVAHGVHPAISAVVRQALEKDPARRFPNALDLLERLSEAFRAAYSADTPGAQGGHP